LEQAFQALSNVEIVVNNVDGRIPDRPMLHGGTRALGWSIRTGCAPDVEAFAVARRKITPSKHAHLAIT
jgi:hypothetical protein